MPDPIRILVADDHLIIRQGLRLILETQDGFEMVGEAADGAEALRLCAELKPDLCHRRLVAEHLRDAWGGVTIIHL